MSGRLPGVHSHYGGIGGLGGVGAPAGAAATAQTAIPTLAGNDQGLTRNNEMQVTSFGISPYLVQRFGDWGTGRLGYSLDVTRSNTLSGFASSPFPTGGTNGQTLMTNEEIAPFRHRRDPELFPEQRRSRSARRPRPRRMPAFVNGATGLTRRHRRPRTHPPAGEIIHRPDQLRAQPDDHAVRHRRPREHRLWRRPASSTDQRPDLELRHDT